MGNIKPPLRTCTLLWMSFTSLYSFVPFLGTTYLPPFALFHSFNANNQLFIIIPIIPNRKGGSILRPMRSFTKNIRVKGKDMLSRDDVRSTGSAAVEDMRSTDYTTTPRTSMVSSIDVNDRKTGGTLDKQKIDALKEALSESLVSKRGPKKKIRL